ncbi:nuclear transport factor 2 family protein [Sphingobium nicotianae]|uniref:Nuclear transport factor 2 family protein n=1 Tax=Sphingobium nicotianae TaxID=2782607 RepID=A0A9X1DAC6_9SPHN|nr:nuclear transport factor 2 family protein [Sphingobium nicotianae]
MADQDVLKLNAELSLLLADYWHEVDFNMGRDAARYYTDDAEFHGPAASYIGPAKIQQFYDWRIAQGPRLANHCFTNLRARYTGPDSSEATYYMYIYAANGVKPLPTHPPITVSLLTERFRRGSGGEWLCSYRRFETLFEGGTPATNPNLDDVPPR